MNKKNTIILIATVLTVIALVAVIFFIFNRNREDEKLELNLHEVANVEKKEVEIPDFTIVVNGSYEGSITDEDLKKYGVQTYEFDAAIDNDWETVTNHYAGVKLKDVFEAMQIKSYETIDIKAPGRITVQYTKDEVSDNVYIIFTRDGQRIEEDEAITIISFDYKYRYAVANVSEMVFSSEQYSYQETNQE